ncbi:MAG: PAS domain S-box protein, partial [Spirochaetales bacterium]|nr:PAS domain S-box protein [Spirochaetales bacterium]
MTWLRFGTLSVGSLNTTILLGLITAYLLVVKNKPRDTRYLAGYLGILFMLLLSYTVRYSFFTNTGLAVSQTSNAIVFGVACLIQFSYHYRENTYKREASIVLWVSFGAAAVIWVSLFFLRNIPEVYDFKAQYFAGTFDARISILVLIFYLWAIGVLLRKMVRFSRAHTEVKPGIFGSLGCLVLPKGQAAVSTRSFALLSLATTIISLLYLLYQTGVMNRETYTLLFNIGSLLTCLVIFVVYVNNSTQPISFITKLVGIPLAVIMIAFGVASASLMPLVHSTLGSRYRDDVDIAQLVLDSGGLGQVPPSIAFMLPVSTNNTAVAYLAEDITGEWTERISDESAVWSEGLIPEQRGMRPTFLYLDIDNPDSFFFMYKIRSVRAAYFVGFRYRQYRMEVHRFASRMILGVLIAAGIVILGFPIAFRRELMIPLARLSRAVEQVSSGNYGVRVAEGIQDEIGQLARGFNTMAFSLENAEGNFKALAENANDSILLLSTSGHLLYANLRATLIAGYPVDELAGLHFTDLLHPDEVRPITAIFPDLISGGGSRRAYETRLIHKNGHTVPVEITGASTVWQGETADVVIIRDITERKNAEEAFQSQQQQLLRTDKLASLGELVAGMAHEINNPNQAISMNTRFVSEGLRSLLPLAESNEELDETIRIAGMSYDEFKGAALSSIDEIEASTKRIDHIVKELKRFVQGGPAVKIEPTEVNSIVSTVVDLSRHMINQASDRFSLDLEADLPVIQADRIGLEQVVLNLLQNACQALTSRDKAISIQTSFDRANTCVWIDVIDEGAGIREEDLSMIQTSFFTTKSETGGTGLGLSVSRR